MRPATGSVRGRPTRSVLAAASVAALLTAGLAAPQTAVGSTVRRATSTANLAPGLTLTKINTSEPMQIRVLTIDPAKAVTLDLATAGGTFGSYARPSTMGANRGALAAINGDFTVDGRPLHPFAEDGFLRSSGLQSGGAFAESKDETQAYLGAETLHMAGTDVTTGAPFSLASWNSGAPGAGEIAAFTSAGGSIESPPSSSCSARLLPAGKLHWNAGKMGVYKDWVVDVTKCQSSPLTLGKGMVLDLEAHRHRRRLDDGHAPRRHGPTVVGSGLVGRDGHGRRHAAARRQRDRRREERLRHLLLRAQPAHRDPGTTADGKVLLVVVDGRAPGVRSA